MEANKFYVLERGVCDAYIHREAWGGERKVHTYQPGRCVAVVAGGLGCEAGGRERQEGVGAAVAQQWQGVCMYRAPLVVWLVVAYQKDLEG